MPGSRRASSAWSTFSPTPVVQVRGAGKDAKTQLQEWLQGRGMALPEYQLVDSHGQDHAKVFDVRCVLSEPSERQYSASSSSMREAEQSAARAALDDLQAKTT